MPYVRQKNNGVLGYQWTVSHLHHAHTNTHMCTHVDMHSYTETSLISIVVCKIHMPSPRQGQKEEKE